MGSNSKGIDLSDTTDLTCAFQSPKWGVILKSKKENRGMNLYENISFRPRNGGIILKVIPWIARMLPMAFQSPQWGSNSKGGQQRA